ncbi:hypothetical protein MMC07_001417 [Pseudocyphellaria aurata]|nr:hypothetical protein [Pseudocyphellaria aurata]
MQFTNILRLGALLAALQVGAAPVAEPEALTLGNAAGLVRRANPAPVSCGRMHCPEIDDEYPRKHRADELFAATDDERAWPLESVQNAYNALVTSDALPNDQKPGAGTRKYPLQYGGTNGTPSDQDVITALDAIPECKTGQQSTKFFEFPLTDPVFTGGDQGSQGPDRVIAIAPNVGQGETRQFTYCLAITHRGGASPSDPSFRPCK